MSAAATASATAAATGTATTINELLRLDGVAMHYGTGETSVTALAGIDLKVSRSNWTGGSGAKRRLPPSTRWPPSSSMSAPGGFRMTSPVASSNVWPSLGPWSALAA